MQCMLVIVELSFWNQFEDTVLHLGSITGGVPIAAHADHHLGQSFG